MFHLHRIFRFFYILGHLFISDAYNSNELDAQIIYFFKIYKVQHLFLAVPAELQDRIIVVRIITILSNNNQQVVVTDIVWSTTVQLASRR